VTTAVLKAMRWRSLFALTIAVATFGLAGPAEADQLAGETYCVGPRGNPDACNTPAVLKKHAGKCWHDHGEALFGPGNAYTDGKRCYICYDECDSTCDIVFLRDHPHWSAVTTMVCGTRMPWAPISEGVKHHVINGRDEKPPPPPPPPKPKEVRLSGEVGTASRGPFAVGDSVDLELTVQGPSGTRRGFGQGEVILRNGEGKVVYRQKVDAGGKSRLTVTIPLENEGRLDAEFSPDRRGIPLAADEKLSRDPKSSPLALTVAACRYRARIVDPPAVTLPGRPIRVSVWVVDDSSGLPVTTRDYQGPPVDVQLHVPGGDDIVVRALPEGGEWRATVDIPEIEGNSVSAVLSASGQSAGAALCSDDSAPLEIASLGVSLGATAPPQCYLTTSCRVSWSVTSPSSGSGADIARAFLSSAVVEGYVGKEKLDLQGSATSGVFSAAVVPEHTGTAFFRLKLRSGGDVVESRVAVEVREDIRLVLPEVLDLGVLSGGSDWEDTCVPLDFSGPGSRGALLAPFSVELEELADCDCQGQPTLATTLLDPDAGEGGLWVQKAVKEAVGLPPLFNFESTGALLENEGLQEIEGRPAMAVCLAGLGRCPSASGAEERTLVFRTTVPEFADQVARVRLRYSVEKRSFLACWADILSLLAAGLAGLFVLYGFIRPNSFSPSDRIRIAGDTRSLARAPHVPLREFPGGRRGWYRSARASVGAGGARLRSPRRAQFVLWATPAGPVLRSRLTVEARDPRSRKMQPVDVPDGGLLLRSGVVYQVGEMFVRMG